MKTCRVCQLDLPDEKFEIVRGTLRTGRCRACRKAYDRARPKRERRCSECRVIQPADSFADAKTAFCRTCVRARAHRRDPKARQGERARIAASKGKAYQTAEQRREQRDALAAARSAKMEERLVPRSNIIAQHPDREFARLYANAIFRARYAREPLRQRRRVQEYKHANPRLPIIASERRAERAKRQSDGTLTVRAVRDLFAAATHCAYCGVSFAKAKATLDHMQPLVLGGAHSVANAAIACITCNLTKGRMSWSAWLARLGDRSNYSNAKALRVLPALPIAGDADRNNSPATDSAHLVSVSAGEGS